MTNAELNKLVAEKVMGYSLKKEDCNSFWIDEYGEEPRHSCDFSDDISAAYEVLQKIYGVWDIKSSPEGWFIRLSVPFGPSDKIVYSSGKTLPYAICSVAIKSLDI
jgi:hypothetical protein